MLDTDEQRKGFFFLHVHFHKKNMIFRTNSSILGEELGA